MFWLQIYKLNSMSTSESVTRDHQSPSKNGNEHPLQVIKTKLIAHRQWANLELRRKKYAQLAQYVQHKPEHEK